MQVSISTLRNTWGGPFADLLGFLSLFSISLSWKLQPHCFSRILNSISKNLASPLPIPWLRHSPKTITWDNHRAHLIFFSTPQGSLYFLAWCPVSSKPWFLLCFFYCSFFSGKRINSIPYFILETPEYLMNVLKNVKPFLHALILEVIPWLYYS